MNETPKALTKIDCSSYHQLQAIDLTRKLRRLHFEDFSIQNQVLRFKG